MDIVNTTMNYMAEKKQVVDGWTKWSVCFYFTVLGTYAGVFSGIVPAYENRYGLSEETMSYELLVMVAGGMTSIFGMQYLCDRFGSAAGCDVPTLLIALCFPFLMAMPDAYEVSMFGYIYGFLAGGIEIAVSAQAVLYEQALGSSAMGTFHACYAVGAMSGSIMTGLLTLDGASPESICQVVSIVVFLGGLFFRRGLISFDVENRFNAELEKRQGGHELVSTMDDNSSSHFNGIVDGDGDMELAVHSSQNPLRKRSLSVSTSEESVDEDGKTDTEDAQNNKSFPFGDCESPYTFKDSACLLDEGTTSIRMSNPYGISSSAQMVVLTIVSSVSWCSEGSVGDWSALYNTKVLDLSKAQSTIAFAVFQGCLVIGRLVNDIVIDRYISRSKMVILSGIVGSMGLFAVVAAAYVPIEYGFFVSTAGFIISGIGVSPLWSVSTSGTSMIEGYDTTYALSIVNGFGYLSLLAFPPLLGLIAEYTGSLKWSFLVDAIVIFIVTPCGFFM